MDESFQTNSKPAKNLSITQRDSLGLRAKNRRKGLKLSRKEVALEVGIAGTTLDTWERSIPRGMKQERVEAWESALEVPNGWLLDSSMKTSMPVPPPVFAVNIDNSPSATDAIRKVGCWISKGRRKKSINLNQLTQSEARAADIFALRYGVAGEKASTLQAIGDSFGLTRERIRQIVDKMLERLLVVKVNAPIIDDLFHNMLPYLPASVVDVDLQFREQLGESLSIEGLNRFAREILGKGGIQIVEGPNGMCEQWGKIVINPSNHNVEKLRAIRNAAIEMIRSCGGAQINWVAGTASWQCGEVVTNQDILRTCRMIVGFNWLVEEDGWFWFGEGIPSKNRVLNLSKKMLAVAGRRLDVEDIQQGLSRARRGYFDPDRPRPAMIEPPLRVVTAILTQMPWIKVIQSDDFLADPIIPPEDVLSDSELEIFNLMVSVGGVMSRYEINQAKSADFSDVMLSANLDNSPIFNRLDTGIFALRGRQLNVASINHALESVGGPGGAGPSTVPADIVDGCVSFQLTLSEYRIRNKFVEVPASVACYLEDGMYVVDGFDSPARSSTAFRRFYQLIQKMIKLGYKQGDIVTIQIFPSERKVKIVNGSE